MSDFSILNHSVKNFEEETKSKKGRISTLDDLHHLPIELHNKEKRLELSLANFWRFDEIYFPGHLYSEGYSKPCQLHYDLVDSTEEEGVIITLAPRKHGKTVTAKKLLLWKHLVGKIKISGIYCETLPKSQNMLDDVSELLSENDLIKQDFEVKIVENNSDQLEFYHKYSKQKNTIATFSEGRSVRGFSRLFSRPEFLLGDDIETLESAFGEDSVQHRINKLAEAYQSLTKSGVFLILGNDFEERGALHKLRLEAKEGTLNPKWRVKVHKAWDNGKALWSDRFKATTEEEYKKEVGAVDESDWQGNYQQNPIPPDGFVFKRDKLQFVNHLPTDAMGVIYCDPNLAIKGKGDTTGIVAFYYSKSEHKYYIDDLACRNFKSSNDLLDVFLDIRGSQIKIAGFDGHVSQESTWKNNVINYCQIKGVPYPYIQFCRYSTDLLAKNLGSVWDNSQVYFTERARNCKDFDKAIQQLFAFSGKRSNKKDDFPDALICAYELIHERGIARVAKSSKTFFGGSTFSWRF
jgi:hypothetical protein